MASTCPVLSTKQAIVMIVLLICSGFSVHEQAFAQSGVPSGSLPSSNPIPPDCTIPPKDLAAPDLPPGMNRVVRIVTLNGYFQPELSTGSLEDMRDAKVSVEPKSGGYTWGKKCKGRVKFLFLPDTDQPRSKTPSPEGGPTSSPPPSAGGSSTIQGPPGTPGSSQPSSSPPNPPSSTTPSQTDRPPTTPPAPPPSTRPPVQTGGGDPCTPPPPISPRTVLVPDVKFLVERCTSFTSACEAAPKKGGGTSDCVSQCFRWAAPTVQGAPQEGETIGMILPGGDQIKWGRDIAAGAQFSRFTYLDRGEEISGPVLELGKFSNGVAIREVEYGRYSTEVPVSLLPVWALSTTAATVPKATSSSKSTSANKPIPVVTLNGNAQFRHQWHVDDGGTFTLFFKNDAQPSAASNTSPSSASGGCPAGGNMVVQLTLKQLQPFFDGLDTQTFTLAPQNTKTLTGRLTPLLDAIKTYESDILFGAWIEIRVWEENKPETLLEDRAFGVYRFLDVADDDHKDGTVAMARTLADGKGNVVRRRELSMQVHPDAELTFQSNNPEFEIRVEQGMTAITFDPLKSETRTTRSGQLTLTAKKDNQKITWLAVKGTGEPQNRIVFDVAKFIAAMAEIQSFASNPQNAQDNPPSYFVHPAFIPEKEWREFYGQSKQASLAAAIKQRMETLWKDAGLMPGIKWVTTVDPANTVDFAFETRENNHPRSAFARAKTPPNNRIGGGGTDNLATIREIVKNRSQYNKAELAFRLSEAINPDYKQTITVWPDSLLEGIPPSPNNTLIFTRDQIVNAFAKTMVHEIGHSWSLDHPVKDATGGYISELQKLVLEDTPLGANKRFQLRFHGQTTGPLSFYEVDPDDASKQRKTGGAPIRDALVALSSIGKNNYEGSEAERSNQYGVFVYSCRWLLNPSTSPADLTGFESLIAECTREQDPAVRDRTFFFEFDNHLKGANVDQIEIVPLTAGAITTIVPGSSRAEVMTKNGNKALIDGYMEDTHLGNRFTALSLDIMAQSTDAAGALHFRSGLSLEAAKMALALDYTKQDVEKVVKYYSGLDTAYTRWGTERGFE